MNIKRNIAAVAAALCMAATLAAAEGGSWANINQELARPEGWQQIVTQPTFALGETTEIGVASGVPIHAQAYGTYPSIDGSTVAVPMAVEFARQFLPLTEEDIMSFVFFSTTHNAYEHLIRREANGAPLIASRSAAMDDAHPVDIIIATGASDEEEALSAELGTPLLREPVCYDAFVFITHAENPVETLTVEQIRKIYAGEITNWREVGGADSEIMAYQREKNSGSQTAMETLVMDGAPLAAAEDNYVVDSMSGLVERVGNYENSEKSLGYTYKYYIDTLYKNEAIKLIAIDGVAPTDENLRSGAYAFSTNYYAVIRAGDEGAVGGQFMQWMISEEGQRCIQQAGYIPMQPIAP